MAWEWSHTLEGIEDLMENIEELPRSTLEEIHACWLSYDEALSLKRRRYKEENEGEELPEWRTPSDDEFSVERFLRFKRQAELNLSLHQLIELTQQRAAEHRTCTNGGHLAHLCPWGCCTHMAPFHKVVR